MASFWGVDMRGMFQRDATEAIMDKEVSQCSVKDLRWDRNRLIDEADDFISPDRRETMINKWIDKKILLRSGDTYEWTEESMAPDLQRMTWSEPPGIKPAETFEARVAEFFNKVSGDVVL
jgi:hypothetical protein